MADNKTPNGSTTSDAQREAREKLCAALRSGKYQQGQCYLRSKENMFCCLGVACDIYDSSAWDEIHGYTSFVFDGCTQWMPGAAQDVYGLTDLGSFKAKITDPDNRPYADLASMNDQGITFTQIADVIDWQWNDGPKPEGFEVAE